MSRTMAIAALVLLGTATCCGAEGLPIGPTPEYGLAQIVEGGDIQITVCVSRPVFDGKKCKWVSDVRTMQHKPASFRVTQEGKPVEAGAAAKLLAKPTPVVFAQVYDFEQKLHAFYLRLFKAGTVIVYLERPLPEADDATP